METFKQRTVRGAFMDKGMASIHLSQR
jgi:hypothetical protein